MARSRVLPWLVLPLVVHGVQLNQDADDEDGVVNDMHAWITNNMRDDCVRIQPAGWSKEKNGWDSNLCGGWSAPELEAGVSREYLHKVATMRTDLFKSTPWIAAEGKLRERTTTDPGLVFCFSVVLSPPEPTFAMVRTLHQVCDGHLFFSNFTDDARGIKHAVDGPMVMPRAGIGHTTLNTPIFLPAWRYIATHLVNRFKWFVKTDLDTVYEPYRLMAFLSMIDHTVATRVDLEKIGSCTLTGPMNILSAAAVAKYANHINSCETRLSLLFPQEDLFMDAGTSWNQSRWGPRLGGCSFIDEQVWGPSRTGDKDICMPFNIPPNVSTATVLEKWEAHGEAGCQHYTQAHLQKRPCQSMQRLRCGFYVHPVKEPADFQRFLEIQRIQKKSPASVYTRSERPS